MIRYKAMQYDIENYLTRMNVVNSGCRNPKIGFPLYREGQELACRCQLGCPQITGGKAIKVTLC